MDGAESAGIVAVEVPVARHGREPLIRHLGHGALAFHPDPVLVGEPDLPEGTELLGRDFAPRPGAAVGGGGTEVFRLRCNQIGRTQLSFELKRPWEAEAIETRTIEVDATPSR